MKTNRYTSPIVACTALLAGFAAAPQIAQAASLSATGFAFDNFLQKMWAALTGPLPLLFSVCAFVLCLLPFIRGVEMSGLFQTLLGVGIFASLICAAPTTVGFITGRGAEITLLDVESQTIRLRDANQLAVSLMPIAGIPRPDWKALLT